MMRRARGRCRDACGATLVELLVATAASLTLGVLLVTVYLTLYAGLSRLTIQSMVTSRLRSSLELIGRDIRPATPTPTPTSPMASPPPNGGEWLNLHVGGDDVHYLCYPANRCNREDPQNLGRLVRVVGTIPVDCSACPVVARDVVGLGFAQPSSKRIDVWLRVRAAVQQYWYEAQLVEIFNLRH